MWLGQVSFEPNDKAKKKDPSPKTWIFWSGLRGSNPPPPPWQGGALPNELNPHKWCLRSESNQRHEDFQSSALPTELQRRIRWFIFEKWRLGWGSNPRPLAWQASALTNWATKPFSMWDKISWWKVQGSNLWPSACKADALPTELTFRKCSTIISNQIKFVNRFFEKN